MVAFAVGGLLGDTLFHLLPEIFVGEDHEASVKFVLVEPNRNLILGLGILVGFMTFVAMDKGLRIATGGAGHDHSHGHSHGDDKAVATSSSVDVAEGEAKSRKKNKASKKVVVVEKKEKEINPSVKLGGYLNLMSVQAAVALAGRLIANVVELAVPTSHTTLRTAWPCRRVSTRRLLLAQRPRWPSSSTRSRTRLATLPS